MADQVTVRARIRRRSAHDEQPPTKERWDEATAATYAEAREVIQARVSDDELVLAWYVDR